MCFLAIKLVVLSVFLFNNDLVSYTKTSSVYSIKSNSVKGVLWYFLQKEFSYRNDLKVLQFAVKPLNHFTNNH